VGPVPHSDGCDPFRLKAKRIERIEMLWRQTRERLGDRGVADPEAPSLKYAIPILEAAADEENEELEDLWSRLLAAAMDPSRRDGMRQLFIQVVKQLDPMDAIVLKAIREAGGTSWEPNRRAWVASKLKCSTDEVIVSFEVVFQPLVGAADELSQRRAGEVAILVDRLDAGSVDRQQLAAVQVETSAQQYELAEHGAKRRAIVAPEIGDGLEVRFQSPQQPEDLDVAMTLRLQPPARSDPVQIAVDVELQKVARRVARTPHRFRLDPQKPRRRKVQSVNEGVDEPHRIVRADIVVHRVRQQQKLVAFQSGDVSHA
jgi:hypothetical protein